MSIPPPTPRASYGHRLVVVIVAAAVVASALSVALYFLVPPAPTCRGGGANVALSCALAVSRGHGICAAGNQSAPSECTYSFEISVSGPDPGGGPLVPASLVFEITDPTGAILDLPFTLTVEDATGCGIAAYNSSVNAWGAALTLGGGCPSTNWTTTALQTGDSLSVSSTQDGVSLFSQPGSQLVVIGVGEFGGQVRAGIG